LDQVVGNSIPVIFLSGPILGSKGIADDADESIAILHHSPEEDLSFRVGFLRQDSVANSQAFIQRTLAADIEGACLAQ
jgi:hypothetical protein